MDFYEEIFGDEDGEGSFLSGLMGAVGMDPLDKGKTEKEKDLERVCPFMCQGANEVPFPKPFHIPKSEGGCAIHGLAKLEDVSDRFTECCNIHHECYNTCYTKNGDKKLYCDTKLKKCLAKSCKKDFRGKQTKSPEFVTCQKTGENIFRAQRRLGCDNYKQQQADACQCMTKDGGKEL